MLKNNRNASRDQVNGTKVEAITLNPSAVDLMLPPIQPKKQSNSHMLPPEGFTYGKPTIRYNHSPYEKEPADKVLNGAFVWQGHEGSKEREPALDFPKLNMLSVKHSVVIPKVLYKNLYLISPLGSKRVP